MDQLLHVDGKFIVVSLVVTEVDELVMISLVIVLGKENWKLQGRILTAYFASQQTILNNTQNNNNWHRKRIQGFQ